MSNCKNIIGITEGCNDNNVGSIRKAWIADYGDISSFDIELDETQTDGGTLTGITMSATSSFVEFSFGKNTSSYTETWTGDIAADVHLYTSSIILGLRRMDVSKRNAISVLAEGRRRLVVIILDNNEEFRVFGLDDGIRLEGMDSGTNETRDAGTFYTITLNGEDKWMAPYTTKAIVDGVIQ